MDPSLLQAVLLAGGGLIIAASLYYRAIKQPLRIKRPPEDWKKDRKGKYAFNHRGYLPDLKPPSVSWGPVEYVLARDGSTRIATHVLTPEGTPKGVAFVFAGLNECIDNNANLGHALRDGGFVVAALDYPAFGRSDAPYGHGHIPSFAHFSGEVLCWAEKVRQRFPAELPTFLVGQSLGGAMAIRLALDRPGFCNGVVALAPGLASDALPILQKLAPILAFLFPRMTVLPLGEMDVACSNLAVGESNAANPLFHNVNIQCATGNSLLENVNYIHQRMEQLTVPNLLIHGTRDMLCKLSATQELHRRSQATDKTIVVLEGQWHDLLHEPEWRETCQQAVDWCLARCK